MRLRIPLNVGRHVWSRWRTNSVPNTCCYQSINPKVLRVTTPSPPQRRLDLLNLSLIHMMCPVMMMITNCLKMWPKRHLDSMIANHANWQPPGSIWIHHLNPQRTGGKLLQTVLTTTPTPLSFTVDFGCLILLTGGSSNKKHPQSTLISPIWNTTYCLSYHMVSAWRPVFHLGEMLSDSGRRKPQWGPFAKTVLPRQRVWANNGIVPDNDPVLDTMEVENDIELMTEAEERKLHRMAKVNNFLEMWQGSQNLHATQKASRTQNTLMTVIGYVLDTEEIINAFWTIFELHGAAAFKLSERSPLPPLLSAKDLLGGQTQILNVRRIKQMCRHPAGSDDDSPPEVISDTENWLNWNGDLDNPNVGEEDWEADDESNLEQDNSIKDSVSPAQRNVSAAPIVSGLIWPWWRSKKMAEKMNLMVSAKQMRSNKWNKKK